MRILKIFIFKVPDQLSSLLVALLEEHVHDLDVFTIAKRLFHIIIHFEEQAGFETTTFDGLELGKWYDCEGSLGFSVILNFAFEHENGMLVDHEISFDHRVASLLVEIHALLD